MLFKLLIIIIVFVVIFGIAGRIRYQIKSSRGEIRNPKIVKMENLMKYSGRAEGRILDHHWEYYMVSWSPDPERSCDSDDKFIVTYEFEVDGKTYTGKGEGSHALRDRKNQTICYDPSDPNDNMTLHFYNKEMPVL